MSNDKRDDAATVDVDLLKSEPAAQAASNGPSDLSDAPPSETALAEHNARMASQQNAENAAMYAALPRLHPAPGRCIIRIVPRLGLVDRQIVDGPQDGELVSEGGIVAALDGRFANQPMVGSLQAIGDPTSEKERVIAEWAMKQAEAGALFVFSVYGAGAEYWDKQMSKMLPLGFDFTWLQGLRLFDIAQLSAVVENTGAYGEVKRPKRGPVKLSELVIQ